MKLTLTEDRPIYIQIKEYIEESILNETMRARFQKTMITEIATLKTM